MYINGLISVNEIDCHYRSSVDDYLLGTAIFQMNNGIILLI